MGWTDIAYIYSIGSMTNWLTWARIAVIYIALLAVILLSGCLGLPTLEATPTTSPTMILPTATSTVTPIIIQIMGDVYVRDNNGNVVGWLNKADQVQARCSADWCLITSSRYRGYYFWRGCSSDNPERKSCRPK